MHGRNNRAVRVLLIQPPYGLKSGKIYKPQFNGPPIGLAYIAAVLLQHKYNVRILDAYSMATSRGELAGIIRDYSPDFIAITAITTMIYDAYETAKIAKGTIPKVKVIIGGPHSNALPKEVISNENVDFVVYGEGEYTMLELIEADKGELANVKGLVFKRNGEAIVNPPRPFIDNLDDLPMPAYSLLPIGIYKPSYYPGVQGQWMPIVTGRGCPFGCIFCDVSRAQGRKHRHMSAERIVDEIEYLYNEHGIRYLSFEDTTFTLQKGKVERMCRGLLERGLKVTWFCNSRIDTLPDLRVLRLMKRAGCTHIYFGIEAGNPDILMAIKHTTIKQVEDAVKRAKKARIKVHGSFMIGLPGETKRTILETLELAKRLNMDTVSFNVTTPFPGTELCEMYDKKGFILTKDWSRYESEAVIETDTLSNKFLNRIGIMLYRSYYLRPSFMLRTLLKMRSLKELMETAMIGLGMFKGTMEVVIQTTSGDK